MTNAAKIYSHYHIIQKIYDNHKLSIARSIDRLFSFVDELTYDDEALSNLTQLISKKTPIIKDEKSFLYLKSYSLLHDSSKKNLEERISENLMVITDPNKMDGFNYSCLEFIKISDSLLEGNIRLNNDKLPYDVAKIKSFNREWWSKEPQKLIKENIQDYKLNDSSKRKNVFNFKTKRLSVKVNAQSLFKTQRITFSINKQ